MNINIKHVEINDNAFEQVEAGENDSEIRYFQPSEISATVSIEVDGNHYCVEFQTQETSDYGAYNSSLAAYDDGNDYEELVHIANDNLITPEAFFDVIKQESSVQEIWFNYVDDSYDRSSESFNGMDANSEVNRMVNK